jgi:CRP-like cAMP-binding protein
MELRIFKNVLLRSLSPETVSRLDLHKASLHTHREIETIGGEIRNLVFLEDGIASTTTKFRNGLQAGVGLAGHEAVLGASVLLGMQRSPNRVYMQNEGWGYICPVAAARREFLRQGDFQQVVFHSIQAQNIQSMQTAGCNARHDIQQRLARWLLLCDDRLDDRALLVSQEVIAEMLGNRRTSIAIQASKLKDLGLIHYSRGKISVVDRAGLERKACECYRNVREHLENLEENETGFGVSSFPSSDFGAPLGPM